MSQNLHAGFSLSPNQLGHDVGLYAGHGAPHPEHGSPSWTVRYILAERFHWTLDYIDAMPISEWNRLLGWLEGLAQGQKERTG